MLLQMAECLSFLWLSSIPFVVVLCSVLSDSLWPHGLQLNRPPLSMGFSRQEYWSGWPFPTPERSSRPRDWTCISCHLAGGFFTPEPSGKPSIPWCTHISHFYPFISRWALRLLPYPGYYKQSYEHGDACFSSN